MLEDFIQSNNLEAKILPYAAKGKLVQCRLFSSEKGDVLAVFLSFDKLSEEKLASAVGAKEVELVPFVAVEDITGYLPEFLPPISVYGVKVVLDKKLKDWEKLRCLVGEEKTLEISMKELLESNEDFLEAEITL